MKVLVHTEPIQWRIGKNVPINVYEGDRPVCQCHTAHDAKLIVEAVNKLREKSNDSRRHLTESRGERGKAA